MTKEELEAIIGENHFTRIKVWPDDNLASLIEGIYYNGMADGYRVAIDRLQRFDTMPIDMAKQYTEKHEKQIEQIIEAIREYEKNIG